MKKTVLRLTVMILLLTAAAAWAQDRTAKLVGYERAEMVQGEVTLAPDSGMVLVGALSSTYARNMGLYLAKGFDLVSGVRVGEIPAELSGGMSFDLPEAVPEGVDTVILTVEDWSTPVAVGLLK